MDLAISWTALASNDRAEPIDIHDMGDGMILTVQQPLEEDQRMVVAWTFEQLEAAYVTMIQRYRPRLPLAPMSL